MGRRTVEYELWMVWNRDPSSRVLVDVLPRYVDAVAMFETVRLPGTHYDIRRVSR